MGGSCITTALNHAHHSENSMKRYTQRYKNGYRNHAGGGGDQPSLTGGEYDDAVFRFFCGAPHVGKLYLRVLY